MTRTRRFALLAIWSLGSLCATAPARAQEASTMGAPPPTPRLEASPTPSRFPGVPLGPVLPGQNPGAPVYTLPPPGWVLVPAASPSPPPPAPPTQSSWYGWQILVPTLVLDITMIGSFVAGASSESGAGSAVAVAAFIARGLTGPIVHLAHHQPLRALGSLALEGALPAIFLVGAFAPHCSDFCEGSLLSLIVGLPIALTAGTAIDVGALGYEPGPAKAQGPAEPAPRWSLAPLVLPPLHLGAAHAGPTPAGAAAVGTF